MRVYENVQSCLVAQPKVWLISGVAGFIGSHLLEALLKLNQRAVGLDNFATGYQRNLDEVRSLVSDKQWQNFQFIQGDIRDAADCSRAMYWENRNPSDSMEMKFSACKVDYVLHQAALGSVPRSIQDPIATNSANVTGFLNMLVAARDAGVRRFIYAASSSAYGDHPDLPKVENVIGKPLSPYAVTKYVNELYASVFAKTYSLPSAGLRYFNVFGPRQDPSGAYAAVIPRWIDNMIHGEPIYINGDGLSSRDFCYVNNVVQANILAATIDEAGAEAGATVNHLNRSSAEVYNIAVGQRTTLNELHALLRNKLLPFHPHLQHAQPRHRDFRAGDVAHSLADIGKAKELLGYQPTQCVEQGLALAMPWYISQSKC